MMMGRLFLHKSMGIYYVRASFIMEFIPIAFMNYEKRNKFDPNYINTVLAGFANGKGYLCSVDIYGCKLENDYVIQGFSSHFCNPVITNYWRPNMTEKDCKQIMLQCFRVLFYRDSRASDV